MSVSPYRVVAYVNGVRIWPRNVSYAGQQGGSGSFSVEVPAVPQWDILPQRSHIAVFFTDRVSGTWRLLCEGDLADIIRSKDSTGKRSLTLQCSCALGMLDTITYTSLSSVLSDGPQPPGNPSAITSLTLSAFANGQYLQPPASTAAIFKITDVNALLQQILKPGTSISGFLPQFVQNCILQSPVEAFYFQVRQILQKFKSYRDDQITAMVDFQRQLDVIQNGFNNFGLSGNISLAQVIAAYENLALYQHTPIPAPPLGGTSAAALATLQQVQQALAADTTLQLLNSNALQGLDSALFIPEVLFIPHLYSALPPACNVIFKDQYAAGNTARHFLQEPTRVITELQMPQGPMSIPKYYMSNDVAQAIDVIKVSNPGVTPALAMTHDLFSQVELLQGIIPVHIPLGLAKLVDTHSTDGPKIETYMQLATRHFYDEARARSRAASLHCAFMPYLVPGFPCLVEDATGPYYGIVLGVQHLLPATGAPTTMVSISHVRPAYIVQGTNRSAPPPIWLNSIFLPSQIDASYASIFGQNFWFGQGQPFAAFLPGSVIQHATVKTGGPAQNYYAPELADFDVLAAQVVPTPSYTSDMKTLSLGDTGQTIAEQLRATTDPQLSIQQYQYRPGVRLSDYLLFHHLPTAASTPAQAAAIDDITKDPLTDMAPAGATVGGHPLFGSPFGLAFVGQQAATTQAAGPAAGSSSAVPAPADPNLYGMYELQPAGGPGSGSGTYISDYRQRVARTIAQQIDLGITNDT